MAPDQMLVVCVCPNCSIRMIGSPTAKGYSTSPAAAKAAARERDRG